MDGEAEKYAELKNAVDNTELVDAHAHNIVALESTFPFAKGFSEADGTALLDAPHTLSFKRNLREISELYGCEASLEAVEEYRRRSGLETVAGVCFKGAGISAVLIDDGLELDRMHDVEWHRKFVPFVGRVLRIERLAEVILDEIAGEGSICTLDMFTRIFVDRLLSVATDIVALKSIVAYRSGLDVDVNVTNKDAAEGLHKTFSGVRPVRIANKCFIDYIFIQSLLVAVKFELPMQIHTGFGDEDLDLRLSNPLHLLSVLKDKRFSSCRMVLLHASYPFSREASYLASIYPQVYLDFGLTIPKLSIHGMLSSLKELLELAPIKKIMFSTDGYAFPETFYLGASRARDVVYSVLHDACADGDLSIAEAVKAAKDILTRNSVHFYKINVAAKPYVFQNSKCLSFSNIGASVRQDAVRLIRVLWVDASGQQRCRVIPDKRFGSHVKNHGVGLSFACMGMSSMVDGPADGTDLSGVGEVRLVPDLSTRKKIPWTKHEEMVLADMHLNPGEAWEYCPREALRRVSKILKDEFDLVVHTGFENEFYLLKGVVNGAKQDWFPFDSTPYCSTSGYDAAASLFHEVVSALGLLDIEVEQLHPESGKGQFEIALGHKESLSSANDLIYTRETIRAVAHKHGFLATFMPKYDLEDIGSGNHVHISLSKNGENVFMPSNASSCYGISKAGEEFMAGVLYHLPSILAFTAPLPNSYDRIQPNTWSGAYKCWGKENREAPLRAASPPGIPEGVVSNFEMKSFDGCANPYLGLASIIAAGIDGLRKNLNLPPPISENPSSLEGKLERLPKSLSESLDALHNDDIFEDLIGKKILVAIKAIRKAEIIYYSQNKDAYKQLIHRY